MDNQSIVRFGIEGCLIGAASLAGRSFEKGSNSATGFAKPPLGALLAAYAIDKLSYENADVSARLVRSIVPAFATGVYVNVAAKDGELIAPREGLFTLAVGAASQIFTKKFVRPEYA